MGIFSFLIGIVILIIIIFFVCSFFGIGVPNYQGIKKIINNFIQDEIIGFIQIENITCEEIGGHKNITGLKNYETGEYWLVCNKFCGEQSDLKNLKWVRTSDFTCIKNKLYCKCTE